MPFSDLFLDECQVCPRAIVVVGICRLVVIYRRRSKNASAGRRKSSSARDVNV
jgi:hypothetical protein